MNSPTEPVTASQLIFTNVEAELSAARRRGFQVWLCSPDLTAEQQRSIAKRLEDFRVPPGAAAHADLARHVYFRTPDGLYGIARTVPLAERDRFGRAGKFHAHAVILSEVAFRRIGCDPFRVIDGGFAFHSTTAEAMDPNGLWRSGLLPLAEVHPAPPSGDVADVPPDRLITLLHHIERNDANPLAIPEPPPKVLALLRGLFRAFPPAARRKLEFDTLSTGSTLSQLRYAVVGAYSAALLKVWAFRRYHRLDLPAANCTPPLDPPTAVLPAELITAPGWRELSDAEQEGLYDEGRRLADLKLDELRGAMLTPAAATVFDQCQPARIAVRAGAEERVRRDVPAGLAKLPGVIRAVWAYLDGPPSDALEKLAEPVPRELIVEALLAELAQPGSQPAVDTLAALDHWVTIDDDPRLGLIVRRWRASADDLAEIESVLANPGADPETAGWLRRWIGATLAAEVRDERDSLAARLAAGKPLPPAILRDIRLWLALDADPRSPAWVELKLATALQQGSSVLARALAGPPRLDNWDGWLIKTTATRLQSRFRAGWAVDGMGGSFLGLFVVPGTSADEVLLDTCATVSMVSLHQKLLGRLWPIPGPPPAGPAATGEPEPPPPEPTQRLYQKLLEDPRKPAIEALRSHLTTADNTAFEWAGNQLLRRAYGQPTVEAISGDVYFVGLKLVWVQHDARGTLHGLFEAIAGATVPEIAIGTLPEVGTAVERRAARRLSWLLARLSAPTTTERLKV